MPGFPVLHYILEFAQTHVHWVSDAIQPFHPLSLPFSSCPQFFPGSGSFPMHHLFASGGQSAGVSASASVLPMNTQGWFPLGWTGLIFAVQGTLKSLLQHHSSKASVLWHSAFFMIQLSSSLNTYFWLVDTLITLIQLQFYSKMESLLLFNMLSRLVTVFLPRSKRLLISWLQSPFAETY